MRLDASQPQAIERAAAVLRAGGLVAFPTETVYGLGADASNPDAVARIFEAKGRPRAHPLIVHLADAAALDPWAARVPPLARRLAESLWPGPLTLVLPRHRRVPPAVTGGRDTVALRVPDHPVALALLRAFGGGIAAPSANRFGHVSPTTAAHVLADLGDAVDAVLDGGPCEVGVESTIVDMTGPTPRLLREGGVPVETVEAIAGCPVERRARPGEAPGTLRWHYAPRARLLAVAPGELAGAIAEASARHRRVAALWPAELGAPPAGLAAVVAFSLDPARAAERLYAALREADARGAQVIVAPLPPGDGLAAAVRDRLVRAAARREDE